MFRKRDTHIHFVGIGGIGMSGIAEVLLNLGYAVTGTDLAETETTRRLAGLGATVHRGHAQEHLGNADVVVISSAVRHDNPEVLAAQARRIPVIPRAEMLAELMRLKQGIAIAGSHGKTTTTSLIASVLHEAGLDPTVIIGGKLNSLGSNARLGYSEILVAEADESDGSFLYLSPTIAVITNIDREHMDHYGYDEALSAAFVGFANRVPFYGTAVVCIDDPNVRQILPRMSKRVITYGLSDAADYTASDIEHEGSETRFRVHVGAEDRGEFFIRVPGVHNVLNALATIAVCDSQQLHIEATRAALANFQGVQRRFTIRGEVRDILVVDDYGHHPTEIRATLAGARRGFAQRRIVALVQPHRYSRLAAHLEGFAAALDDADVIVVTEVYAAGEVPMPGIDGQALVRALGHRRDPAHVHFVADVADVARQVLPLLCSQDLVVTMGAGSITKVSYELVEALESSIELRAT